MAPRKSLSRETSFEDESRLSRAEGRRPRQTSLDEGRLSREASLDGESRLLQEMSSASHGPSYDGDVQRHPSFAGRGQLSRDQSFDEGQLLRDTGYEREPRLHREASFDSQRRPSQERRYEAGRLSRETSFEREPRLHREASVDSQRRPSYSQERSFDDKRASRDTSVDHSSTTEDFFLLDATKSTTKVSKHSHNSDLLKLCLRVVIILLTNSKKSFMSSHCLDE